MWGCFQHWKRIPRTLQSLIWKTFEPGQEISGEPSAAYLAAAEAVQSWIKEHGGPV